MKCPGESLLAVSHPIADPAYRADKPPSLGVVAELAAQVPDVYVDKMLIADPLPAPTRFR